MAETITIQIPDSLAKQAREIAIVTQRQLEDVLLEWLGYAVAELPVESLPDEQVLALCNLQMQPEEQETLSDLLYRDREGQLSPTEVGQLDDLMQVYRRGLVRKAKALHVAVSRGLRPALS